MPHPRQALGGQAPLDTESSQGGSSAHRRLGGRRGAGTGQTCGSGQDSLAPRVLGLPGSSAADCHKGSRARKPSFASPALITADSRTRLEEPCVTINPGTARCEQGPDGGHLCQRYFKLPELQVLSMFHPARQYANLTANSFVLLFALKLRKTIFHFKYQPPTNSNYDYKSQRNKKTSIPLTDACLCPVHTPPPPLCTSRVHAATLCLNPRGAPSARVTELSSTIPQQSLWPLTS